MSAAIKFDTEKEPQVQHPFAVKHYTVKEIAELWQFSEDAVREIFEKEAGVLVLTNETGKYRKRRYTTLRIPESVVERVHRRMSRV